MASDKLVANQLLRRAVEKFLSEGAYARPTQKLDSDPANFGVAIASGPPKPLPVQPAVLEQPPASNSPSVPIEQAIKAVVDQQLKRDRDTPVDRTQTQAHTQSQSQSQSQSQPQPCNSPSATPADTRVDHSRSPSTSHRSSRSRSRTRTRTRTRTPSASDARSQESQNSDDASTAQNDASGRSASVQTSAPTGGEAPQLQAAAGTLQIPASNPAVPPQLGVSLTQPQNAAVFQQGIATQQFGIPANQFVNVAGMQPQPFSLGQFQHMQPGFIATPNGIVQAMQFSAMPQNVLSSGPLNMHQMNQLSAMNVSVNMPVGVSMPISQLNVNQPINQLIGVNGQVLQQHPSLIGVNHMAQQPGMLNCLPQQQSAVVNQQPNMLNTVAQQQAAMLNMNQQMGNVQRGAVKMQPAVANVNVAPNLPNAGINSQSQPQQMAQQSQNPNMVNTRPVAVVAANKSGVLTQEAFYRMRAELLEEELRKKEARRREEERALAFIFAPRRNHRSSRSRSRTRSRSRSRSRTRSRSSRRDTQLRAAGANMPANFPTRSRSRSRSSRSRRRSRSPRRDASGRRHARDLDAYRRDARAQPVRDDRLAQRYPPELSASGTALTASPSAERRDQRETVSPLTLALGRPARSKLPGHRVGDVRRRSPSRTPSPRYRDRRSPQVATPKPAEQDGDRASPHTPLSHAGSVDKERARRPPEVQLEIQDATDATPIDQVDDEVRAASVGDAEMSSDNNKTESNRKYETQEPLDVDEDRKRDWKSERTEQTTGSSKKRSDSKRHRSKERRRDRERDKDRDRNKDKERGKDRQKNREKNRDKDKDKEREKDKGKDKERDKDKEKERDKDKDKDREKDKEKKDKKDRKRRHKHKKRRHSKSARRSGSRQPLTDSVNQHT